VLKLGLLPTEKVVPLLVGVDRGLFRAGALSIEIVSSATTRDQRFTAGEFDVVLMNLVSAPPLLVTGVSVNCLTVVERSAPNHPMFKLLASPVPRATNAIGTSLGTISEFVASNLGAACFGTSFTLVRADDIAVRSRDLIEGRLGLAVLPEPMAAECIAAGCVTIADDRSLRMPPPLLVSRRSPHTQREELTNFERGYRAAVELCAGDRPAALATAIRAGLPFQSVSDLPDYPDWAPPDLEDVETCVGWWAHWKGERWAARLSPAAILAALVTPSAGRSTV
jgi:hypothetical protein